MLSCDYIRSWPRVEANACKKATTKARGRHPFPSMPGGMDDFTPYTLGSCTAGSSLTAPGQFLFAAHPGHAPAAGNYPIRISAGNAVLYSTTRN